MNEACISVIIPVFRVEKYLPRCLKSLQRQTWHNLEIILVDDGSDDSCPEICDAFAGKDSRFKVIHKKNAGVAEARNDGLDIANGAYIAFADSDDWLAEDAFENLYNALLANDADCAVGGCQTVIENEDGRLRAKKEKGTEPSEITEQSAEDAMKHVLLTGSAVWNRLFKRSVFDGLRFPKDRVNDDEVIALRAYNRCEKIVFIGKKTYFYRIRENSITTSSFSLRNMDVYYNACDNLEFIKEERPALIPCAEYKMIKTLLYCSLNLRRMEKSPEQAKALEEVKAALRSPKVRIMIRKNPYLSMILKAAALPASL